jgi:hypothetical protein
MSNYTYTSGITEEEYFRETRKPVSDWLNQLGLTDKDISFSIRRITDPDLVNSPEQIYDIVVSYKCHSVIWFHTAVPVLYDTVQRNLQSVSVYPVSVAVPGEVRSTTPPSANAEYHGYKKVEFKFGECQLDTEYPSQNLPHIRMLPELVKVAKERIDAYRAYEVKVAVLADQFAKDMDAVADGVIEANYKPYTITAVAPCYAYICMSKQDRGIFIPVVNRGAWERIVAEVHKRIAGMRFNVYDTVEPKCPFYGADKYTNFVVPSDGKFDTLCKFDEKLFDEFLDIPGEIKKAYTEEGELIRTALRTVASIPVNPA